MAGQTVVVVGGGVGGTVASRRLRRLIDPSDRVIVVERSRTLEYAPSYGWVLDGRRKPEQVQRPVSRIARRGVELVTADVLGIDPEKRRVETSSNPIDYDRLVVALGAETVPEAIPGFVEGAHDVYSMAGSVAAHAALSEFSGGEVVVLVSRLPYKCPAAPFETAFLAQSVLGRTGALDSSRVSVYTPEPAPLPTAGPVIGEAVTKMLDRKGIAFHTGRQVERVDAGAKKVVFADGTEAPYDLLLGIPAHKAPDALRSSGLGGPNGYVPVDPATLATRDEAVYALGDAAAVPLADGRFLPKAGVFAHAEAEVVARRVAASLAGVEAKRTFSGRGACFMELGGANAAIAVGNFFGEGPAVKRVPPPGPQWHLAKVLFEQYWLRLWW